MCSESVLMNLKKVTTFVLPLFTWKKTKTLIKKEAKITPLPISPARAFDNCLRPNPLIKNPTNGRKGISQTSCKVLFIIGVMDHRQPTTDDRLNTVVGGQLSIVSSSIYLKN